MPNKPQEILIEAISILFILLFVYTGISKLVTNTEFQNTLAAFPLLHNTHKLLSFLIPVIELLVAGLLTYQRTRRAGLFLAFLLMVAFTIYIGYAVMFEPKLPCSCGGILKQMSWRNHLVLNIVLSILSLVAYLFFIKNNRVIAINRLSRKPV